MGHFQVTVTRQFTGRTFALTQSNLIVGLCYDPCSFSRSIFHYFGLTLEPSYETQYKQNRDGFWLDIARTVLEDYSWHEE